MSAGHAGAVPVLLVCSEQRRAHLTAQVRGDRGLSLVEVVTLPGRAPAAVQALGRGVLLLDADVDGGAVALVRLVMSTAPAPILVLVLGDALPTADAAALLAAGAVEVRGDAATDELSDRCRVLAGVGVVRRRAQPRLATRERGAVLATVVAVGASTGGPPALAALLAGLGGIGVPVLVVQHIAPDFLPGLAAWLSTTTSLPVTVARDGEQLRPGEVHLAPGGQHLRLLPGSRLALTDVPHGLHVPSVDVLFSSVAACPDVQGIGILLTGMGRDGARGLLELRAAGGRTLVQDEATSTVFGMPRAGLELGAAEQVVALPQMAGAVRALLVGAP